MVENDILQKGEGGNNMTIQRFLVAAFLVFLLGIGVLYAGINRVPFRQDGNHHEMHKSSLSTISNLVYSNTSLLNGNA